MYAVRKHISKSGRELLCFGWGEAVGQKTNIGCAYPSLFCLKKTMRNSSEILCSPHKGHFRFHFPRKRFNLHLEAYSEKHLMLIPRSGPLQQNNIFSLLRY